MTSKGVALIIRECKILAEVDLDYWWQFRTADKQQCHWARVKYMPDHSCKYLYDVCGADHMNLCRIGLDILCKDASSNSLGHADIYREVVSEHVQAFCSAACNKYVYVADDWILMISGKQISVTRHDAVIAVDGFTRQAYTCSCSRSSNMTYRTITWDLLSICVVIESCSLLTWCRVACSLLHRHSWSMWASRKRLYS